MAASVCQVKFVFVASQRVVAMKGCVGGKAEGRWISAVTFPVLAVVGYLLLLSVAIPVTSLKGFPHAFTNKWA